MCTCTRRRCDSGPGQIPQENEPDSFYLTINTYRCAVKNNVSLDYLYQSWPADAICGATFSDNFLDTNTNLLRDHDFDNVYTLSGVPRHPVVNIESL